VVSAAQRLPNEAAPRRNMGAFAGAAVLMLLAVDELEATAHLRGFGTFWRDTLTKTPVLDGLYNLERP